MPRMYAIAAVTIDGKIARHENHPTTWTSPEDNVFMRALLDQSAVIVVGRRTYDTAKEPLSKRNCIVLTRSVPAIERRDDRLTFINTGGTSLRKLLQEYATVAVLGGTQIYTYCLEHDLLDDIYLTIEPLVFGAGLPLFAAATTANIRFQLQDFKKLNADGTLVLHYARSKSNRD